MAAKRIENLISLVAMPSAAVFRWMDRLPAWLEAILVAVAWAVAVLAAYSGPILTVWDGWTLDQKLSLGQVATGVAGFGGGFVGLLFAGRALATSFGDPEVELTGAFPGALRVMKSADSHVGVFVTFSVENHSDAIPTAWQFAAMVDAPGRISPQGQENAGRQTHNRRRIVWNSTEPLFTDSVVPVGSAVVSLFRPSGLKFKEGDIVTHSFQVEMTLHTNLGRPKTRQIPIAIQIERPPPPSRPRFKIDTREASEDATEESVGTKE